MHCHPFSYLLVYLSKFFSFAFYKWFWKSYQRDCPGVSPFEEITATELNLKNIHCCFKIHFTFFFFKCHFYLFEWIYSQCPYVFVMFLRFKRSDAFLVQFFYIFLLLIFFIFRYEHGSFFNAKSNSYLLNICSSCLYQGLQFFFFLRKYVNILQGDKCFPLVMKIY